MRKVKIIKIVDCDYEIQHEITFQSDFEEVEEKSYQKLITDVQLYNKHCQDGYYLAVVEEVSVDQTLDILDKSVAKIQENLEKREKARLAKLEQEKQKREAKSLETKKKKLLALQKELGELNIAS